MKLYKGRLFTPSRKYCTGAPLQKNSKIPTPGRKFKESSFDFEKEEKEKEKKGTN
jgi:hypothetical protein